MLKKLISVLIPCFNGASYLGECVESVLAQSVDELEVVIVDDGSTDATAEMAGAFARRDSRVRVVVNEANLGLVRNWARCIELARGEWLKFVFQDDLIDPTCIEDLLNEGGETGCPLVFCRRRFIYEDGTAEKLKDYYQDHLRLSESCFPTRGLVPPKEFARKVLASPGPDTNFIGEPISVLFKKSLVTQFGGFNPLLAVSCDSEFWQRIGVNVGVAHVPTALATFRVHPRATTSTHLREKQFRMNVLDPVVVMHEHAFHPDFEPLRRVAFESGKDLEGMFREKALWAFKSARAMATASGGGNAEAMEDWRRLAVSLPRLSQFETAAANKPGLVSRALTKTKRLLAGM